MENEPFLDYKVLYAHVKKHLSPKGMNYLFFDEIQMVDNFQKMIDNLFLLDNDPVVWHEGIKQQYVLDWMLS